MASSTVAMPAAVYSIFMYVFAAVFGMLLNKFAPQPKVDILREPTT
jgi:BASS family bile acid:Na+ symporter